jgi:hypothetical protein
MAISSRRYRERKQTILGKPGFDENDKSNK